MMNRTIFYISIITAILTGIALISNHDPDNPYEIDQALSMLDINLGELVGAEGLGIFGDPAKPNFKNEQDIIRSIHNDSYTWLRQFKFEKKEAFNDQRLLTTLVGDWEIFSASIVEDQIIVVVGAASLDENGNHRHVLKWSFYDREKIEEGKLFSPYVEGLITLSGKYNLIESRAINFGFTECDWRTVPENQQLNIDICTFFEDYQWLTIGDTELAGMKFYFSVLSENRIISEKIYDEESKEQKFSILTRK